MIDARTTLLALTAAMVVGLASHAGAAVVTTSITNDTGAGADAYIQTGNATNENTNFGNSTLLAVKLGAGTVSTSTVTRMGYVRFDISGYDLAASPAAVFKLYAADVNGSTTVEVYGLNDGHAGESWVEGNGGTDNSPVGEIDWDNAPAKATTQTTYTFEAASSTLLGSFAASAVAAGTEFSFSSAALNTFLLNDTNGLVTLMLRRTTASDALNTTFAAREHATITAPTLQFDIEIIPAPAAMPAGLALIALTATRRRRPA